MKTNFPGLLALALALLCTSTAFAQQSAVFAPDGKALRSYDQVAYFTQNIAYVAKGIEIIGILAIIVGIILALTKFILPRQGINPRSYKILRQDLGKSILLGLEILVAGDIIETVVTEATMEKVLVLGMIVLIRTFLSLSLEVEIEGKFPWQKDDSVD
jgi:uncharacterized membrane protein